MSLYYARLSSHPQAGAPRPGSPRRVRSCASGWIHQQAPRPRLRHHLALCKGAQGGNSLNGRSRQGRPFAQRDSGLEVILEAFFLAFLVTARTL